MTGFQAVNLGTSPSGGLSSLQGIRQSVTIGAQPGQTTPTALNLDDSGGTVGQNWTLSPTSVSGASPAPIDWTAGQIDRLGINGGSGGNTFVVNDTNAATTINPGVGFDSLAILGTTNDLVIDENGASASGPSDSIQVTLGPAIAGALSILGDVQNADLVLDGTNSSANVTATLSQGQISGLMSQPIRFGTTTLSQISYLGGSGADTLTVDFSGGNPVPSTFGLLYDGNAGFNTLALTGGSFTDQEYRASNSTDGFITLADSRIQSSSFIRFLDLSPIIDTVPAENFTFVAPDNVVAVNIVDGPISQGFQTTEINSGDTPAGFELIDFANKTNVVVDLTGIEPFNPPGQLITLNTPTTATGLVSLSLASGISADQINVVATAPGVATSVNSGPGDDQITVSAAGLGEGGSILFDGGTGADTLTIDAGGAAVSFTATTVNVAGRTLINLANLERVNIINAANPPLSPIPTTIHGSAGFPLQDVGTGQFTDADANEPRQQLQRDGRLG